MNGQRKPKKAMDLSYFLLVLHIFDKITNTYAVEGHGQAFIQTDNELRYMVDGVPLQVISGQGFPDFNNMDSNSLPTSPISFDPPLLDFDEQPVGMPKMEQVTLVNRDGQNSIHLLSISGSTVHFHCSFFQDKVVPPGANTTFDVVFLARQLGNVENTLYIHTSQGTFRYQVFGVGTSNPYRLQPFLGAKVPLNSSFSPLIQMHNPHPTAIQVVEMYSSGGDLHLELPTGEKEAPRNMWEIPPYETRTVMRASFVGRMENNHTSFIRIKTNKTDVDEMLVLPVEVEVTSAPGIYSPVDKLDFDILRTLDAPRTLRLNLINSGTKPIHVSSVSLEPPNEAVHLEFRPVKLLPGVLRRTPVALVTYTATKALHPRQWSGNVVIKAKDDEYKLVLPYRATVLHGSLVYDANNTKFYSGKSENVTRGVPLTNTFNFTLVIYNVSLPPEVEKYFSIVNFTHPAQIKPKETLSSFSLHFHPNSTDLHFTFLLRLWSNASIFHIPIFVYNGRLRVVHHRPEIFKGQLDFGTMGVEEQRSMTFTLRNDNPVDIVITEFGANMDKTVVELLGVEKGNGTTLTRKHNTSELDTKPLVLKPFHYAVFSVNLVAPDWEGTFVAEIIIVTQFEHLYIPMTLRTAEGSLNAIPEKIVFEKVYPGKISYKVLRMHSSFDNLMEVRDVSFQPNDTRFYYVPPKTTPVYLTPQQDTVIGRVYFDAKRECQDDCYVGLPTYTAAGHPWLLGLTLDKEVADTDQYLFTRLQQMWEVLGAREQSTINVTIQLDTNQVRGFLFPAHAHLCWPPLIKKSKLKFPLTQIGNLSTTEFYVENPGDVPVLVQVLPLSVYPNPQTIVDMVSQSLPSDLTDYIEMDDEDIFRLQDLEIYNSSDTNPVLKYRKHIEGYLGVKPHRNTIAAVLQPGTKLRVRLAFQPKDDTSKTTLILVRNNLTIVDTVVVQGRGGMGDMRFSNRRPGSQAPLLFDMTEKHLKNCDNKKQNKAIIPNFTVKRSFTVKNSRELPFYVHKFGINGYECEGYGFRVLNCEGFQLEPNASRKIDIAFTPDFTMSRIQRTLTIDTTLGPPINYTLQATLPPHMLNKCSAALPRPPWEPVLYYSATLSMFILCLCVIGAAYFESDRIFMGDIMRRRSKATTNPSLLVDKGKMFDLKNIAGVKEVKMTKPDLANGHVDNKIKVSTTPAMVHKVPVKSNSPDVKNSPQLPPKETKVPDIKMVDAETKQRKPKLAKKHSNEMVDFIHVNEKKLGGASGMTGKKSPNEKQTTPERENVKDTTSSMETLDPIEVTMIPDVYTEIDDILSRKDIKPKLKRKSKTQQKDEVKEKRAMKQLHSDLFVVENDDTSSTTTESSLDIEDKSSARDSTPEPQVTKTKTKKNNKNKNRLDKKKIEAGLLDDGKDDDDDDFVLTTKSKAHKKIKVDSKKVYGGNILRPSTLELPYTTKLEASKENQQPRHEPTSPHSIAADIVNRASKKNSKLNRAKPKGFDPLSLPGHDTDSSGNDSLPILWDSPINTNQSVDGDFSDLAMQTEAFALKHGRQLQGLNGNSSSPEPTSSLNGSRSGSYSSIVSSNGSEANPMKTKKESRRNNPSTDNKFAPITVPGPVGSKTKRNDAPSTSWVSAPWNLSPVSPTTPDVSALGLHPIQEIHVPVTIAPKDTAVMDTAKYAHDAPPPAPAPIISKLDANAAPFTFTGTSVPSTVAPTQFEPPVTMMQRLQAERKKRLIEYQKRLIQGEEWPGFDMPVQQSDSLWDSPPFIPTSDAWTAFPSTTAKDTTWAATNTSPNNSWSPMSTSLWSSGTNTSGENSFLDLAPGGSSGPSANKDKAEGAASLGSFDPFNTLGSTRNIWGPGAGTTGWNLKAPDQDPDH
ncbi:transmembrane protein 131-like isoform X2 [Lineus longissimus]|uniref:transmembrane protein 131-like isoform X2 n=1 Tax=Lineus longissimus TaxID=88925 RepID=UPI00315D7FF3